MTKLQFPTKGETIERGQAISIINTGYLPFIPFTTQYKMGLAGSQTDFLVPTRVNLSEQGRSGVADWAYRPKPMSGNSFKPNIERYNEARAGEARDATPGYGMYDKKADEYVAFGPEKFQRKELRDRQTPTDQLMDDLRFTPNNDMFRRSTAIAAELANIVSSMNAGEAQSQKEDAEMEEEAILDLFYESEVPELQAIMQEARAKAEEGGTSVIGNRKKYGLSPETYDWSVKDMEDLTKMHAMISIINQNARGDLLSDKVIGLEVTKDVKFFAEDRVKGDYGNIPDAEKAEKFLADTRDNMQQKFDAINKKIKEYLTTTGHMYRDMTGGKKAPSPHTLEGFTMQTISRAREALLHDTYKDATYAFQFPDGTKAEGGPYEIALEIIPVFDSEGVLQRVNHTVAIVEMAGYEGARAAMQPGMANLLLKHMHETLKLDLEVATDILNRASTIVGTELQLMADRGNQIGTRFQTDLGFFMGDSYIAYTTMTSTMSNKEISDALFGMIMESAGSPENTKELAEMLEAMFNDGASLTQQWKDKVGGNDYTVDKGFVYAKGGGPFTGDGTGQGVGVVPFIGSSRQMGLTEALQRTPAGMSRIGTVAKNPIRRMTGQTPGAKDLLFRPDGTANREKGWLSKAFGINPSKTGFENMDPDGVIRVRESWFKKYGASRNIKEFNPYTDRI
tara:strand:+ start:3620 stop:5656 length:2037 start_codon:yes stop_codon:yes gene_type:complete